MSFACSACNMLQPISAAGAFVEGAGCSSLPKPLDGVVGHICPTSVGGASCFSCLLARWGNWSRWPSFYRRGCLFSHPKPKHGASGLVCSASVDGASCLALHAYTMRWPRPSALLAWAGLCLQLGFRGQGGQLP